MSFPKAKIHRYYDDVSCAPPPGKYDPKFDFAVKVQRFSTPKMENASSIESIDSCCSSKTPIFRTPSKVILKKGPMSTPKRQGSNLKTRIPLPDKLNACQITNSDQKIYEEINELARVHQNQLLEKNEEIANLLEQVNVLNSKISFLEVSQLDPKNKSDYEKEINKLRKELMDLHKTIAANNDEYNIQVENLKFHISALEENISNHLSLSRELEDSLSENHIMFDQINSKISQMADDFNIQLNHFIESMSKVEDINKCLLEDYEKTLDLLSKESEDNISNKKMLIELQENIDICRDDLKNATKRCKMYEVVQTETSKTINVLSKRLMESEVEVDHLNDIQQDLVLKKSQLENQVKVLSEENHLIRKSLDELQQSIKLEVEDMQNQLLQKVESYKKLATDESERQRVCISEKQNTIDSLLTEIDCYKIKKTESDHQLVASQAKIATYKEEITKLKKILSDIELNYEEKLETQRLLFSQLSNEYESLKDLTNMEKHQLEKQILLLNNDKATLEKNCSDKDVEISNLLCNAEKLNVQISLNENKIEHLEKLALDQIDLNNITTEINNFKDTLKDKTKIIDDLELLLASSVNEKKDLEKEKTDLIETLALKNQECTTLEKKYDIEIQTLSDLKRDIKMMEESNHKYIDEIISELVLEKERVSELSNAVEKLELDKKKILEENEGLKKFLSYTENSVSRLVEQTDNQSNKDLIKMKKIIQEQLETIQLFEYERIAQFISQDEFIEEKEELLKNLERQNREIEVLSETTDRHYATRRELEQEISRLNDEKEQLKDAGKEDSMKVTSLEARIADLECRNQELLDIIGPFKNQLIQFEQERNFLLSKTENTEKELRALELEHARSLGHQNHKQKIKHVVNLHETIANLKKEVEKYRLENTKLRHELTSKKPSSFTGIRKNKENKSKSQQKERTTSPATALKDRNG